MLNPGSEEKRACCSTSYRAGAGHVRTLQNRIFTVKCHTAPTPSSRNERVTGTEFWKQGEVPVARQQRLRTVRDTDCRNPGIVYDASDDPRTLDEPAQDVEEVVGLAYQTVRRRHSPGVELSPCAFRCRCSVFPDPAVRHDAQELVTARPRNRLGVGAFGKFAHDRHGGFVHARLPAMRIDEEIGIDRNHLASGGP